MSFEVWLQCFEDGEPAGLARASIRPLFPVVEAESEADRWTVRYGPLDSCEVLVVPLGPASVTSLAVSRPCGDLRLWEALLAVLRLGPVVLYFPGEGPPLVADAGVARHLPPDLVSALGPPRVVGSAREIADAVDAA